MSDRTVVVAGDLGPVATAIAARLAGDGDAVVLAGPGLADDCPDLAAGRIVQAGLDVTDPAAAGALVAWLEAETGSLDVWVNARVAFDVVPAESIELGAWDAAIGSILTGTFVCAQAAGARMLAQGRGVIVNLAGADGVQPIEGRAAGAAAAGGVMALTRALGVEWAQHGVRVAGVAFAAIEGAVPDRDAAGTPVPASTLRRRTPLRRLGTAHELAEAVAFLANEEASFITAEMLSVDGGWLAYHFF